METYLDRIKLLKNQQKLTNDQLAEKSGIPLGNPEQDSGGHERFSQAFQSGGDLSGTWMLGGIYRERYARKQQ